MYTREQLAKMSSEEVRKNPELFSLFEQYVKEDVCELYYNCQLPYNCFGCHYSTFFAKWSHHVLQNLNTKKNKKMSNSKVTYQLKDERIKLYFKGEILDKNSPDESWNDFINFPEDAEKVKKRKELFDKLPSSRSDEPKTKSKSRSRSKAKTQQAEVNEASDKKEESTEETKNEEQ